MTTRSTPSATLLQAWSAHVASPLSKIAALALALLATSALAQTPAPNASIEGRVQNLITGDALENARVVIKGTNIETFTDAGGAYRLNQVPGGLVALRVFYTGLDELEITVNAQPGQITQQDFRLTSKKRYGADAETIKLDEYVVQATKETNASNIAVNEQR